jgi:hypothetical protein
MTDSVRRCEANVASTLAAVTRWRRVSWLPFTGLGLAAARARHKSAERALGRAILAAMRPPPKGAKIDGHGFPGVFP